MRLNIWAARVATTCWLCAGAAVYAAGPAGETMRLSGHTDAVLCGEYSPDGTRIVTGSADTTAIVWDVVHAKRLHRLEGHVRAITGVGFSGDGRRVVTGSADGTARVWDATTGELLAVLDGAHGLHVHAVAISADGRRVLTGSCDHTAVLWDVAAEKPVHRYQHVYEVHAVGFAPDGKTFFSACHAPQGNPPGQKNLRLYDATTDQPLADLELKGVASAAYVNGGKRLLVCSEYALWVVDAEHAKLEGKWDEPAARGMSFWGIGPAADGRRCLVGSPRDVVYLDLGSGETLRELPPSHRETIRVVAIAPDGKSGFVAGGGRGVPWFPKEWSRGEDCDVKLISLAGEGSGGGPPGRFEIPRPAGTAKRAQFGKMEVSPDGSRVLTLLTDGQVVRWDAATGKEAGRFALDADRAITAFPGGRYAAAREGQGTGGVVLYDVEGGKPVAKLATPDKEVSALAVTPDGHVAFAAGYKMAPPPNSPRGRRVVQDVAVRAFDPESGRELRRYGGAVAAVRRLAVSPDGHTLVGLAIGDEAGGPSAALAWDVSSGNVLWNTPAPTVRPPEKYTGVLSFSPDGQQAAYTLDGGVVTLVELRTGKAVARFDRHVRTVYEIGFDPDGRRLWTAANCDAVRAYDRRSGDLLKTVKVGTFLSGCAFRFDGKRRTLLDPIRSKIFEYDLE